MRTDEADRKGLLSKIRGHQLAALIHLAARWDLADRVGEGQRIATIADALSADVNSLRRMTQALASFGIFAIDHSGFVTQTAASRLLMRDASQSLHAAASFWGSPAVWQTWGDLEYSNLTGKSAFEQRFHRSLFEYLSEDVDAAQVFNRFMTESPEERHRAVIRAYDFSSFNRIADIGGGSGQLLVEILNAFPKPYGVLCDRAEVVRNVTPDFQKLADNGRCEARPVDFFVEVPRGADVYLLSQIIHDWDDASALRILRNCGSAAESQSVLLLIERASNSHNSDVNFYLSDMEMLVLHGACERSTDGYRNLLHAAGFHVNRIIPTNSPFSIIECVPS